MTKRVFVTGADGFIGSHLVEHLVASGRRVRALALYNAFDTRGWLDHIDPKIAAEVEIVAGDVRDASFVRRTMQGCESVLHLAALIGIPYSYHAPESYVDTNVKGTLNILEAARDLGVGRVIQTSTSEVYGTARTAPITEEHPLNAQSPYAATKIAADQLALSYHASFGLPVVIVRPFNTYGPRQSTRAVIPTIITQIAGGAHRIRLGSIHPTRDLNFVGDTVRAFGAALDAEAAPGQVVNVGTGYEISVGDLAALIAADMGAEIEIETDAARVRPGPSEVERLLASNERAHRILGWTPARGGREGLRAGLAATIAWFREPANLARYRQGAYTL